MEFSGGKKKRMIVGKRVCFCFPVLETVSVPWRSLSGCQTKQQILEKEILYLQIPTLNLLGSRYVEAWKCNNGLRDLQSVSLNIFVSTIVRINYNTNLK